MSPSFGDVAKIYGNNRNNPDKIVSFLLLVTLNYLSLVISMENITWYAYKNNKHLIKSAFKRSSSHGGQNYLGYASSRNSFKVSKNNANIERVILELSESPVAYTFGKNGKPYPYRTYNERNYYYGHHFHDYPEQLNGIECFFELNSNKKESWNLFDEKYNITVEELVFTCTKRETCCDIDCCQGWSWWKAVLLMVGIAVVCFLCCYCCTFELVQRITRRSKKDVTNTEDRTREMKTLIAHSGYKNENVEDPLHI